MPYFPTIQYPQHADKFGALMSGVQSGMQIGDTIRQAKQNKQIQEAEAEYKQKALALRVSKAARQQQKQEFDNTLSKMNVSSDVMLNRNLSKETRYGGWKAYRAEHNRLMANQPLPELTQEQYFAQENTVTKGIKQVSSLYQEAQKDPRAMKMLVQEYPRIISESLGAGAKPTTFAPLTQAIGGLQQQTQRGAQANAMMGIMGKPEVGPPTSRQQAIGSFIGAGGKPGSLGGILRAQQPTRGITVAPGAGVINPLTGKSIYQQPEKTAPPTTIESRIAREAKDIPTAIRQTRQLRVPPQKPPPAITAKERIEKKITSEAVSAYGKYGEKGAKAVYLKHGMLEEEADDRTEGLETLHKLMSEAEIKKAGKAGLWDKLLEMVNSLTRPEAQPTAEQTTGSADQIKADFQAGKISREQAREKLEAINFK